MTRIDNNKRMSSLMNLLRILAITAFILGIPSIVWAAETDAEIFTAIDIEVLEYRVQEGKDLAVWEGEFRAGDDDNKVVLRSEGEYIVNDDHVESAEFQLLYRRLISDFYDLQAGARFDLEPNPTRAYAVLGITGLAPQWIELEANLFLNDNGDLSARVEADTDFLLTQRLILQPKAEINFAFSDDEPTGIGTGFTTLETGLRLRYEVSREVAPYIGVNWERKLGNTEDLARDDGEEYDSFAIVAGVKLLF